MTATAATSATTSTLAAADGVPVTVRSWAPAAPAGPARGVVVVAHGMAEHAARYGRLAEALTADGWAVLAPDHRGHGVTAGGPDGLGHLDDGGWVAVVADLRAVVVRARAEHPGVPVVLLGHSMGSLLARTLVLDHADDVDALVLSGTAGDPGALGVVGHRIAVAQKRIRGAHHRSRLLDRLTFGAYNTPFERRTGFEWLSRDTAEVDAYVADERCGGVATTSFYTELLGAMGRINDPRAIAGVRADLPVLLLAGDADPVGGNGRGVRQVAAGYRNAGVDDVTLRLYPGARHEIFNETNRGEVTADLLSWLRERFPEQERQPLAP